ncbi:MAG: phosphoglucosamine mutase, partial [Verrucomicrobiota bacterium]
EEGFKLPDSAELQIEALIEQTPSPEISLSSKLDLSTSKTDSALYQNRLLETLPKGFSLKGFTIVTDCANGASFQTTPKILSDLGARVIPLHTEPDGKNINKNCGSQHPQDACQKIRELAQDSQNKALIGICHDGDADRLILIDDQGNPLDGDELLAILAVGLLKQNQLSKNTLVATVMSNLALEECLTAYGGTVVRTVVGDRYVLEAMQTGGFSLGGEQSGHMIFRDHLPTGDGLLSALQALHSIQQSKEPLSQQRAILKKFPQKLFNLPVKEKLPIEEMPQVEEAISKAEASLANQGRILFRYSGTENKARLLVEAKEASSIEPLAQSILEPLKAKIGV